MIDCHAHFIPPALLRRLKAGDERLIGFTDAEDGYRFQFPRLSASPAAPASISSLKASEAWRAAHGIATQVMAPWTDLFGYTLPAEHADRWTRRMNESLAEACIGRSNYLALGSISLQHPRRAVRQVRDLRQMGFVGVMIGTSAPDHLLDDRQLDPVWDSLAEDNLAVFVHPIFLASDPLLVGLGLRNAVGRSNATTAALARILRGGVLERHPTLKVIAAHGGGAIPFLLPRLQRSFVLERDGCDPTAAFQLLSFDSIVLSSVVMKALLLVASPSQVLLGSDWPFPWTEEPEAVLDDAVLGAGAAYAIRHGNAERLFHSTRTPPGVGMDVVSGANPP